jgi:CarD family transcriptional regulator
MDTDVVAAAAVICRTSRRFVALNAKRLHAFSFELWLIVRSGREMPSFKVGDKVVYPHHGAAVIKKRELLDPTKSGSKIEYFVLKLAYGDLTLMVPVDKIDEVGIREVISREEVEEVFAVLRKKEARMPTNWSRRFKNHVEKLKSGDIYQVAEVVRNLSLRDKDKGLSAGEKRMLARARQILVSELTFAINVSEEEAEKKLDEALT